ncbi:hypothetical protein [Clostridium tetani]|uniref:Uncharacterized protein n=1 Tax=Clostridium tetani TaxID=1513 RepID=A0ABY0EQJ2_CLOTA|nr:hypothetical protein [Clostridium tetani]KHO38997.1 hypothetical protein OR62_08435 [Clostridium tetani]RXI52447.1 hypothetical protein DP131_12985 [Clostridium tetani]RXI70086.1 hypothetical protein DQN76_07675 [Clostridium tetani]CDI49741.1 hypothetical protein BN906_01745 [Clostridium tetani 12124569]
MSLFLGKIHYWLFDKIKWFENLEEVIINWTQGKNDLRVEEWREEIYGKYGSPLEEKPLEELIDVSNIHGWLQDRISKAEGRQAALITKILEVNPEYIEDLKKLFEKEGYNMAMKCKEVTNVETPMEMFNTLNNFILEGMPCDRANEEVQNTEVSYVWRSRICLHTSYWEEENGAVENFYTLRNEWIKSFVETLNNKFKFTSFIDEGKRNYRIEVI